MKKILFKSKISCEHYALKNWVLVF